MKGVVYIFICFSIISSQMAFSRGLPHNVERFVDSAMHAGVDKGYYPGASIAIGSRHGVAFSGYYGYKDIDKQSVVGTEDLYDLASCTKIVATTFALMRLYDQNLIDLNKHVGYYLSEYRDTPLANVSLPQLLTHTSGLSQIIVYRLLFSNKRGEPLLKFKYDPVYYKYNVDQGCYMCSDVVADSTYISSHTLDNYVQAGESLYVNRAIDTMLVSQIIKGYKLANRGRYIYCDTNFFVLRQIIERITGMTLDSFVAELFAEIGMNNTGFRPLEWAAKERIIPTEYDYLMRRGLLRGYPHDELAAVRGGVEGNAGLFSNVEDISIFCEMMLGRGDFRGRRILSSSTVDLFIASPLMAKSVYRGLGFDKRSPSSALYPGYGHTGYTGTFIWIDPTRNLFMVFLSNRVNPTRLNTELSRSELRTRLWEQVKSAF